MEVIFGGLIFGGLLTIAGAVAMTVRPLYSIAEALQAISQSSRTNKDEPEKRTN
ncbi:hypothetical protein [Stratiformator vulcanicus]|uniref:Uncharacterized protein n=1 Tax=Stratiformator vulcanicus TaxID=2527980 RepID=A0A517R663_9PLAN|nr:hypothetical protein [Stratiformator vulcanicus]QDT39361.1 hypothetical protein Pan189_37670 [Stratiformator vulcanicus]